MQEKIDTIMHLSKMQGGDSEPLAWYVDLIVSRLPQKNIKILDMGSGIAFSVEKELAAKRAKRRDIIHCMDMIEMVDAQPKCIEEYIVRNIESDIRIKEEYDVIFLFEVLEHVDKTDVVIENAYNALKKGGYLYVASPNLSSIYSRIELLLGFQPHCLEISNISPYFGGGIFARKNCKTGKTLHHIRGISRRALRQMLEYYGFTITYSFNGGMGPLRALFQIFPNWSSTTCFECKKM